MGGGTVKFYLHILKEHKIYRHLKTSKCICYSWDQWVMKYYPERVDELIEIIQRNAKRLQTLIGNIRDVTKIESNANTKYGIIGHTGFSIICNRELQGWINNNPIFVGDRDWIVQVLSNLLGNAIKFTNQGGISINLFEKIQDEGDRKKGILVTVPDTGNGIIVKFLQGYFQKFA